MIIHLRPMKTVLKILFYFFTSILIINCSLPEKKCTLYKKGSFEFKTKINNEFVISKFIRNDSLEIEYFQNKIDTSFVRWVSDCEFILTKKNPESMEDKKAISMKILSTDEKGYNFEFSIVGNKDTFFRGRANRIN